MHYELPKFVHPDFLNPWKKPSDYELDFNESIAQKLTIAIDPAQNLDLVRDRLLTYADTGTPLKNADYLSNPDTAWREYTSGDDFSTTQYTMLIHLRVNGVDNPWGNILGIVKTAGGGQITLGRISGGDTVYLFHGASVPNTGLSVAALGGDFHRVVITWDGATGVAFMDKFESRSTCSQADSPGSGTSKVMFGAAQDESTSNDADIDVKFWGFCQGKILTDSEIDRWLRNPYHIMKPRIPLSTFVAAAGGYPVPLHHHYQVNIGSQ